MIVRLSQAWSSSPRTIITARSPLIVAAADVVTSHLDDLGQAGAPHTAAPGESTGRNGGWTLLWHQGEQVVESGSGRLVRDQVNLRARILVGVP